MFCTKCGKESSSNEQFCSKCGNSLNGNVSGISSSTGTRDQVNKSDLIYPKNKIPSKWIGAWAFLWPGIPQCILGQKEKGIMYIFMALGIEIVVAFIMPNGVGWAVSIGMGIASCTDAVKAIDIFRAGKPIGKWDNEGK